MTLEEAIKHCEEKAEEQSRLYSLCPCPCDGTKNCMSLKNGKDMGCTKRAADHRQLAEWLTELKEYREDDWKKVEEEMPEPWYIVLVWREIDTIEIATWARDKWLSENHSRPLSDVKYWRTLKIPKEERRTKNDT